MNLLDKKLLNTVVALSYLPAHGDKWNTHATGFMYGKALRIEGNSSDCAVFLVTNRHVLMKKISPTVEVPRIQLFISSNMDSENHPAAWGDLTLIDEDNKPVWLGDEHADLAIMQINIKKMHEFGSKLDWLVDETDCMNSSEMKRSGIIEGEDVHLIGFPGILPESQRVNPVFRQGSIANIQSMYNGERDFFFIDSFSWHGNSGSPIFIRPYPFHVAGTKQCTQSKCIGILTGSWEPADLDGFKHCTGLAKIWPLDFVERLIDKYIQQKKLRRREIL